LMEEHMPAPSGDKSVAGGPSSRLSELRIALPAPPTPLGAYVESSDAGNLLFLSGMLPVVDRKLAIAGRLGENLSVKEGQEAARIASLNALAAAKQHLGDLDRLKKLVKLTVLMVTTEQFAEHAPVADGASDLFVQIFGAKAGHVRLVYGVQSLPVGAPLIVDVIFEIEPARQSTAK
jgi:enamine deaminase RidA (YjgF/YER057c/UK114 family)